LLCFLFLFFILVFGSGGHLFNEHTIAGITSHHITHAGEINS